MDIGRKAFWPKVARPTLYRVADFLEDGIHVADFVNVLLLAGSPSDRRVGMKPPQPCGICDSDPCRAHISRLFDNAVSLAKPQRLEEIDQFELAREHDKRH